MQFVTVVFLAYLGCVQGAALHGFLRKHKLDRSMSHSMLKMHPYFHSTDQIHDELVALATRCPAMTLESRPAGDNSIDIVTIKAKDSNPVNKNFLLFGEHARELISPESGLHFMKNLCGEAGNKERAAHILQDSEFQIVVNGNPASRKKVEQGNFCLRVNENGVDLNRNWDEEWKPNAIFDTVDTNPGPSAFSEVETQVFKDLVSSYRPTNFLTVHSGTKGMYMPWAFDMQHLATRNQKEMLDILTKLDKNHCECPFGAAGKEVGYSCPGTCLDWVYDKLQTPYAFAFEIYANPNEDEMLKDRWTEKMQDSKASFLQTSSHLGHEHFKDVFKQCPSDFVQVKAETKHLGMSMDDCFMNFNPDTQELYDTTVENWSAAYLDLAEMVVNNLKGNIMTAPTQVADAPQQAAPAADKSNGWQDEPQQAQAAAVPQGKPVNADEDFDKMMHLFDASNAQRH